MDSEQRLDEGPCRGRTLLDGSRTSCGSGAGVAAVVTGTTPRAQRAITIGRFLGRGLHLFCKLGGLTTGFGTSRADVLRIIPPTTIAGLHEQVLGRGLLGSLNGCTERCRVLDVQGDGLPGHPQLGTPPDMGDQ